LAERLFDIYNFFVKAFNILNTFISVIDFPGFSLYDNLIGIKEEFP